MYFQVLIFDFNGGDRAIDASVIGRFSPQSGRIDECPKSKIENDVGTIRETLFASQRNRA